MNESKQETNNEAVDVALRMMAREEDNPTLHPPVDDLTQRRTIEAALDGYALKERSGSRTYLVPSLAAAAILLALALTLGLGRGVTGGPGVEPTVAKAPTPLAQSTGVGKIPKSAFALLQGEVNCDDGSVRLGAGVPTGTWIETGDGQAALSLPSGIAVGLGEETAARMHWDGQRSYAVEMNEGTGLFSVDPDQARKGFKVITPRGEVLVTGTLFTVLVKGTGEVEVHLHKGSVLITPKHGESMAVNKGQVAILDMEGNRTRKGANRENVLAKLLTMGCMDGGRLFSELDRELCQMGGELEEEPEAAATLPGKRDLHRDKASARELLEDARVARREKRYGDSASALRRLISNYPGNNDARTALVSLGNLELTNLGQPGKALIHFSKYLKSSGPLTQEALHGKAGSQRALGDGNGERSTLELLVRKFPEGPAAASAKKRLLQLGAD